MSSILSIQTELTLSLVGAFLLMGYVLMVGNGSPRRDSHNHPPRGSKVLSGFKSVSGSL